jgi:rare lipoprotein A
MHAETLFAPLVHISLAGRWLVAVGLAALLSNISSDAHAAESAAKSTKGKHSETGLASYYARRLDGKKTASGDTFRNSELVAAHPRHPFGTRARVTNLENGKSVVVQITDRGAAAAARRKGVIIDLSQAAATELQMKKDGRVRVRVEVLEWGDDYHKPLPDVHRKQTQK